MMGPDHFWWGGWWMFPMIMPLATIIIILVVLYLIFGRGGLRSSRWDDYRRLPERPEAAETALDILKKRYAKGEITREEYERTKKDLQD
jgi:putative membrane protein